MLDSLVLRLWFRLPICLSILVPCAGLLSGCDRSGGDSAPNVAKSAPPPLEAEVYAVKRAVWPVAVRTQGALAADVVAVVGTKVAGRIETVHVDLGDQVRAGEELATLDQEENRLEVSQAEAQLAEACAAVGLEPGGSIESLDRMKAPPVRQEKALWDEAADGVRRGRDLHARNAISEAEVERLEAAERVAAARYSSALNGVDEKIALIKTRSATLALARQRLNESVIRSPFDGRILQRQVAPGEYVPVGQAVATVVRSNPLRYRGTIPERHARQLKIGQPVTLHIESIEEPRQVQVTRISPALDESTRSLLFEALVDNSDGRLQTGLFAEGEVVLDATARALVVPASSLTDFAGAEKVWKVVDGMARQHEVTTGRRRHGAIEILSGLEPGDQILYDASAGRVARVLPKERAATLPDGMDQVADVPSAAESFSQ